MSTPELRYDWTYSDYARLPDDGNRYEVIDGELLETPSPSPLHQRVAFRLAMALDPWVERLGLVIPEVDLLFQTGQFVRPDLLVVPAESRDAITNRGVETAPLLVVEILSPTSGAIDRVKKPARYGDFGIPEYWVLDPEERLRLGVAVLRGRDVARADRGPARVAPAGRARAARDRPRGRAGAAVAPAATPALLLRHRHGLHPVGLRGVLVDWCRKRKRGTTTVEPE